MFHSNVRKLGSTTFPGFTGVRVMMLPFKLDDIDTLPPLLDGWRGTVRTFVDLSPVKDGVGYLTIDEALVREGETHRRPGLHVDGMGVWGSGSGGWADRGMMLASSDVGCRAWGGFFEGEPDIEGDCEHLRSQCEPGEAVVMQPGEVYWCGALAMHESIPMTVDTRRQLIRLSMPSDAPWFDGYTRNPLGVEPTGPVWPARTGQMTFRTKA